MKAQEAKTETVDLPSSEVFQNPAGYGPRHPDLTLRLVLLRAGSWAGDLKVTSYTT